MTKLNVGCGDVQIKGYVNIDRKNGHEAHPLPGGFTDLDEIRASHVLEHFHQRDVPAVLKDWVARLRPGGVLKIAVPDLGRILAMRDQIDRHESGPYREDVASKWRSYLCGGWCDADDKHGAVFTGNELTKLMVDAGLAEVQPWEVSQEPDTAAHPVSLARIGTKPFPMKITPSQAVPWTNAPSQSKINGPYASRASGLKICSVMSVPRLGWQDNFGCMLQAMQAVGSVRLFTGAYWEQGVQNAMETCIAEGFDVAVTVDWDSVFTFDQIKRLLGKYMNNPQVDALAAMQCRRTMFEALNDMPTEVNGTLAKVQTAHFGLTVIDLDKLSRMPMPWFHSMPGPDGSWTKGRVDADIGFWHRWRSMGNSVYVAADVRIGHLELMVAEFTERGEARHVRVQDWHKASGLMEA